MTASTPRRPWTAEDDALLIQMREQGVGGVEMCRRPGRHYGSVYDRLQRLRRKQTIANDHAVRDAVWSRVEEARAARDAAACAERAFTAVPLCDPPTGRRYWDRLSQAQREAMS